MSVNFTAHLDGAHRRVGKRRTQHSYTFASPEWRLLRDLGDRVGIAFIWRADEGGFLKLRVTWQGPGEDENTFGEGQAALAQVYSDLGIDVNLDPAFFVTNRVVAAVVPRSAVVRIQFTADTDDETFIKACMNREENQPVELRITTKVIGKEADDPDGEVRLCLQPGQPPEAYRGYAALDIGSAGTTLACLGGGFFRSELVNLLDIDGADDSGNPLLPSPNAPPVDSVLRFDEVLDPSLSNIEVKMTHPLAIKWEVGGKVLSGSSRDGVVFGAKRLLAGQDHDKKGLTIRVRTVRSQDGVRITSEHPQTLRLMNSLPGELLACRILQRFREVTGQAPPPLAITYPTTFSDQELDNLREVVVRALARQDGRNQSEESLQRCKANIKLEIDEASAAAFYFLFKRFVEVPGGLSRFGYLYPHGRNLLLFDVGAGTTDICLVNAHATPPRAPYELDLTICGRGGLRDFGGDDITAACFNVLKAMIATKVASILNSPLPSVADPRNTAGLAAALKDNAARINTFVPTQFDRMRMNNDDRAHQCHTRDLWALALDVKHRMEHLKPDGRVNVFAPDYPFVGDLWSSLFTRVGGREGALREELRRLTLPREMLDVLVRQRIERAVDRCNWLIERKLVNAADGQLPKDVHWVEIIGNGVRYPLVQEILRDRLQVPFYDERQAPDMANLKGAVAKGAALALAARNGVPNLSIRFDWQLSRRLPYDIGVRDGRNALPQTLFHEAELYEDLQPRTIAIVIEENDPAQYVVLERSWPGELDASGRRLFHPWLRFPFPHGIQGPVTISYEAGRGFVAQDGATTINKPEFVGDPDVYLAPPERGTM